MNTPTASHSYQERLLELLDGADHVIWDWNGTLLNDVDHAISTVNFLLAEHGLPALDRFRYQKIFEFPIRRYYDNLGFDYAKESFESLCHRFVDRFMAGFHALPLVENIEGVVKALAQQGKMQSILSATDQPNLNDMIAHYGLNPYFANVFGINDKLASSKLERGRELLSCSGMSAERTTIVGDTLHDLEVARALGIDCVLVGHGHQCPIKLQEHHSKVVCSHSLREESFAPEAC